MSKSKITAKARRIASEAEIKRLAAVEADLARKAKEALEAADEAKRKAAEFHAVVKKRGFLRRIFGY